MDGVNNSSSRGGTPAPAPAPIPNTNAPPPFLSKTYDMVDDPSSDAIVSWSSTNNSFVVWNPPEFARDLLPKYFKHNNFSSFVRQLNTYQLDRSEEGNFTKKAILRVLALDYDLFISKETWNSKGFRKVDPDRWEFANEGFLRGQKHLLKSITRRKPAHGHSHQQAQQSHGQSSSVGPCVEVGKFGLEEEVERLKRDKNVLMQELVRLRQQQQATDNQMQQVVQRLQGMEQRQQQMMSFLAKAVQSPGFLTQFVQQQNESNRRITEANKKRRLKQEGIAETEYATASDGQIVKYQPLMNDAAKAMLRQILKLDTPWLESFDNNSDSYLIGNGSISSGAMDSGSTSNRSCGVTLQEVPPTSVNASSAGKSEKQSFPQSAASEKVMTAQYPDVNVLVGASEKPSVPVSVVDVMPELSPMPEMATGSILDIPEENYMGPETGNDGVMDPNLFGVNGVMPIDIGSISPDTDIDDLLCNSSFWDDLVQSPLPEDIEIDASDASKGNEVQPVENGWDKEHMDQLTEQMGLLSSDAKRV